MTITTDIKNKANQVRTLGQELQRMYFDHERFYDHINGAESMDNASNWATDFILMLDYVEHYNTDGDRLRTELQYTYDAFNNNALLMERHGAGEFGAARGINEKVQFAWSKSKYAAHMARVIANDLKITINV